jgi:hypothetical protein
MLYFLSHIPNPQLDVFNMQIYCVKFLIVS